MLTKSKWFFCQQRIRKEEKVKRALGGGEEELEGTMSPPCCDSHESIIHVAIGNISEMLQTGKKM